MSDVTDLRFWRRRNISKGGNDMGKKILLGMSGGVDSTYAVFELQKQGFSVEGAVLKMSDSTDVAGAVQAAEALGVPLHVVDCTERFRRIVIEDFISEYTKARTPNPCVICNRFVKMAALCEVAASLEIPAVATGHYARLCRDEKTGRFYIAKASDIHKDQSYVLWRLSQEQLSMLHFPLERLLKTDIRQKAKDMNLAAANAPDSQEICFIPDGDYASYVESVRGRFPKGFFIDDKGMPLGEHQGIVHYTIGQRKGLGVSFGHPVFVSAIDAAANTVTLSEESAVFSQGLLCRSLNFMKLLPGNYDGLHMQVKIRYSARPEAATVQIRGDVAQVQFDYPVRAVTPGQSAVFYQEDEILFGGIIDISFR